MAAGDGGPSRGQSCILLLLGALAASCVFLLLDRQSLPRRAEPPVARQVRLQPPGGAAALAALPVTGGARQV